MENSDWLPRMERVEMDVKELKNALLGTLDGKPGLRAQMDNVIEMTQRNSEQLDGLRLDRAKVAGLIVAMSTAAGLVYKLFLK